MRVGHDVLGLDLYGILEVPSSATELEIRRAYRRLVMRSHPDLNPHGPTRSPRRMVQLNIAATVLLEPERRAEYDHGRDLIRRRCWRPPAPQRQGPGRWSTWPGTTTARSGYTSCDWQRAPRSPRAARRDRDVAPVLDRLRQWPARLLQELAWETGGWSPRQHVTFTLATFLLACLLIAAAQPANLPDFGDEVETARSDAGPAQSG